MSRNIGPKCRLCRREGESICESHKCAILKKNYAPGMHGNKFGLGKKSEYSRQLREKQKAKRIYGVTEKQFHKYYILATKKTGVTGNELLRILETRLDNALFRSGMAITRPQARQVISHGLVKVDGQRVKTPSLLVKEGMKVELKEKILKSSHFSDIAKRKNTAPHWMKADYQKGAFEISAIPGEDDLPKNIESQLIVELYSK